MSPAAFSATPPTPDFSVPHFEKMLEDLGGLLWCCARAAALYGDADLAAVARDVKRYLDAHLWNDRWHGFGGSQDADEHYYTLDAAGRAQLPQPYVDRTIYIAWNAQTAHALLGSAPLLGDSVDVAAWQQRGLDVLETLWQQARLDGLMCRYYDGSPHVRGLLADQVWMLYAMLSAHAATGAAAWLSRVAELFEQAEVLYDPQAESYLDRVASGRDPGRIADPTAPFEENCLMARVLLDAAAYTGEARYRTRAASMLRRYSQHYETYGLFAAAYASAVLDLLEPPIDAHIVGDPAAAVSQALRRAALGTPSPPLRVDPIDPTAAKARLERLGFPASGPIAYVCDAASCFARVDTVAALRRALADRAAQAKMPLAPLH